MIVQKLREIQDKHGYLPAEELNALHKREGIPLYRLNEVASSFPHFRKDPPAVCSALVCRDMACHMRGAPKLRQRLDRLAAEIGGGQLEVKGVSCLGNCDRPIAVSINDHTFAGLGEGQIEDLCRQAAEGKHLHPQHWPTAPLGWKIDPYNGVPKYEAVRRIVSEETPAADALAVIEKSGLVGKGGPGLPTANKWREVIKAPGAVKYVVCNGDESEPGTFKDRELLLRTPHLVIEGVIVAGLVLGATKGYIYIRHEYHEQIEACRAAIRLAEQMGACGQRLFGTQRAFPVEVFVSPGGYICGEQTALIEAMEDKRAEPRNRPPTLEIQGLWNKPTLVNNVETLAWAPSILLNGADWYRGLGTHGASGMRFVSISGDVAKPDVYEVPLGIKVGELLELAGGVVDGPLQAFAPSGPSGGFLPTFLPKKFLGRAWVEKNLPPDAEGANLLDISLDNGTFRQLGLSMGAAHVVYGRRWNLLEQAVNATQFFRNESCGKCVPCRMGSQKLTEIGEALLAGNYQGDPALIKELGGMMESSSICGLGQVAPAPLTSIVSYHPQLLRARDGDNGVAAVTGGKLELGRR